MKQSCRRIALTLESDGPGGAEVFLLHSAEELRRRGWDVLAVLPSWKSGWLAERFSEHGFRTATFTLHRPFDLGCLRSLVRLFRKEEIAVVHSHEFTMAVYGSAACRILGNRHIVTMHGNQRMTEALRRRIALRWAFRSSAATVAVSEDTRRHLIESLGIRPSLIRTIPNGIPDPAGDPSGVRAEFDIEPDEVVLLAVGNLTERKGHIILLKALRKLTEQGLSVPWRLIIAGEGPERDRLEAFRDESGLKDRVHLPGHRNDVADLQAMGNMLVMPSLWEGLPLAVLEAMFAGNPVVASKASGIPEAVRDGVDGILTETGDIADLARAIRTLLERRDLRERMGAAAAERARSRFSIGRMMDEYEELYLTGGGSPARGETSAEGLRPPLVQGS
jgi:glycosyltransferase involved in cell wall biosynthesis